MILHKPQTWIELNKSAFDHNIQLYRNVIGPHKTLSVVVKSNAYGHGIKEIGAMCQENTAIDWLCTTSLSEAIILRNHHVIKPVLVLSIIDEDPTYAATHNIDLAVFDQETLASLNATGINLGIKIAVHIKVDTGVSRFGFNPELAFALLKNMQQYDGIQMRGIFTHCAESGNPDHSFTMQQLEKFNMLCKQLETARINIPFRHASNSAATTTLDPLFARFNFVRIGAGAYGLQHVRNTPASHPTLNLQPVLTWKTHIAHLKQIPANTYVGYDRTYQTTRETTLATLPLGYFEGYDRRLSNIGKVLINDYYAQVVGRICMNAILIAIPAGKTAQIGDEVILLGDVDGLRAHDIATLISSFNAREITTRLNSNIKKMVMQKEMQQTKSTQPNPCFQIVEI